MTVHTVSDKVAFYERVFGAGILARNSKNFDVWCPMCAPRDRNKKKLVIRVEDDANHCWTCGWRARTLAPLLVKFGTREHLNEYREKFGHKDKYLSVVEKKDSMKLPDDVQLLPRALKFDPDVKAALRYLDTRNVSERDMWYYRLCVSNDFRWRRRVIVPSFDAAGRLNYFVARAIDSQRRPKYDSLSVEKHNVIFNELYIDWSKRLVVCEGAFDMIKCGDNATCLMGSDFNEESLLFSSIIIHKTPVALALDPNMLETKVQRYVKKLEEYDIDVKVVDVSPYEDPGSMPKERFQEALERAFKITWSDSFSLRLKKATRVDMSI